jgi:hypothetical protein
MFHGQIRVGSACAATIFHVSARGPGLRPASSAYFCGRNISLERRQTSRSFFIVHTVRQRIIHQCISRHRFPHAICFVDSRPLRVSEPPARLSIGDTHPDFLDSELHLARAPRPRSVFARRPLIRTPRHGRSSAKRPGLTDYSYPE